MHHPVIHYELFLDALYQNLLLEFAKTTDFHRFFLSDLQHSGSQLLYLIYTIPF